MDEAEVTKLLARLRPLLDHLAAESGLSISVGKASYTRHNAVFAIEAAVRGAGGVAMGREAEAFLREAIRFGLQPDDLGRDFQHFDTWYRILGMKPRSKCPVVCAQIASPAEALHLFPAHLVRHYLEAHGMRTKVSPHARVDLGGDEPGEPPAVSP
ncbi:MAG: hypothetical protein FJ265_00865 [Planctomycetes bacterium]|nr:hypothetical protein [Planctomycetota bacterium]